MSTDKALLALGDTLSAIAAGEEIIFRASAPDGDTLVIYSTMDARLAEPLVKAFQTQNPGARVVYEDC